MRETKQSHKQPKIENTPQFHFDDEVEVIDGFYLGEIGRIFEYKNKNGIKYHIITTNFEIIQVPEIQLALYAKKPDGES